MLMRDFACGLMGVVDVLCFVLRGQGGSQCDMQVAKTSVPLISRDYTIHKIHCRPDEGIRGQKQKGGRPSCM